MEENESLDKGSYTRLRRTIYRNKDLRSLLFAESPYCCWCGRLTRNDYPDEVKSPRHGLTPPDDMATIEHLYDRFDQRRREVFSLKTKKIACWKCNHKRGAERLRAKQMERQQKAKALSMAEEQSAAPQRLCTHSCHIKYNDARTAYCWDCRENHSAYIPV